MKLRISALFVLFFLNLPVIIYSQQTPINKIIANDINDKVTHTGVMHVEFKNEKINDDGTATVEVCLRNKSESWYKVYVAPSEGVVINTSFLREDNNGKYMIMGPQMYSDDSSALWGYLPPTASFSKVNSSIIFYADRTINAGVEIVTLQIADIIWRTTGQGRLPMNSIDITQEMLDMPEFVQGGIGFYEALNNLQPDYLGAVQSLTEISKDEQASDQIIAWLSKVEKLKGISGKIQKTVNAIKNKTIYITYLSQLSAIIHDILYPLTDNIAVRAIGPELFASIKIEQFSAYAPALIEFDASGSFSPNHIWLYRWNFGEGYVTTEEPQFQHIFFEPGIYSISLTITDSKNQKHSTNQIITIKQPSQTGQLTAFTNGNFTLHRFLPDLRVFIKAGNTYYHIADIPTLERYTKAGMSIIDHPEGTPIPEDKIHSFKIIDNMVFKDEDEAERAVYIFKAGIWKEWEIPGDLVVDWDLYWQNYYSGNFDQISVRANMDQNDKLGFIQAFIDWDIFLSWGFSVDDIRFFPKEFIEQFCMRGKNIVSDPSPETILPYADKIYKVAISQPDEPLSYINNEIELLADSPEALPQLEEDILPEPTLPQEITVTFPYSQLSHTLLVDQDSVLIALNPTAIGGEDPIIWQCYDNEDIISNGIRGRAPTIWHWFKEGRTQVSCYAGYTSEVDGWHYGYEYVNVDVFPPALPEEWGVPSNIYVNTVAADDNYIYMGGNEGAVQLGYMRRVRRNNPEEGYEKHTGWQFYKIMNTSWGILAATWRGLRLSTDYGENWPDIFLGDEPMYDVETYTDASLVLIGGLFNSYRGSWRVGEPLVTSNIYGGSVGPYNLMRLRKSSTNMDVLLGTTSMEGPSRVNYHRFYNGVGGGAPNTTAGTDFSHAISSLFTTDGQTVLATEKTTDQGEPEQGQNIWRSTDYGLNWDKSSNGLNIDDDIVGFVRAQEKPNAIFVYSLKGSIYSSNDNGQTWQMEEDISRAMPIIRDDRDQFITTVLVDDEYIVWGTTKGIRVSSRTILRAGEAPTINLQGIEEFSDGDSLRIMYNTTGPGSLTTSFIIGSVIHRSTVIEGQHTIEVPRPVGMTATIYTSIESEYSSISGSNETTVSLKPRKPIIQRTDGPEIDPNIGLQIEAGTRDTLTYRVESSDASLDLLELTVEEKPGYVNIDTSSLRTTGKIDIIIAPDP